MYKFKILGITTLQCLISSTYNFHQLQKFLSQNPVNLKPSLVHSLKYIIKVPY